MLEINKEKLDVLIQLQEIGTESYRIKHVLQGVEENKDALKTKLTIFKEALDETELKNSNLKGEYKEFEFEHQTLIERVDKSKETLKILTSNKEYQVLQREIDDNKKRISKLEDEMLQMMDTQEAEEVKLKEQQNDYTQLESQLKSQVEEIDTLSISDRKKLVDFEEKIDDIGKILNTKLLDTFKRTSELFNGKAVVPVIDEVCHGCFMNIPPQMVIDLRRCENLHFCPQCQRIIYWKERT